MKRFLIKIFLFLIPVLVWFLILGSFADGNTDNYYQHFTSPKPDNMILGSSRAAQGINPNILNKNLPGRKFDNFALTVVDSPYGEIYLNAVKKKLDSKTKDGIFILGVDPWNLSITKGSEDFSELPEYNSPLRKLSSYASKPNYEYLARNFHRTWYHIFRDRESNGKSKAYLHQNGWMEVNVSMKPTDVTKRENEKYEDYKKIAAVQYLSDYRLKYLEETISFLKNYGQVYLVRIPCGKKIKKLEQDHYPEFDKVLIELSKKSTIPYFNFNSYSEQYQYTDGNHMFKESGKVFTKQIADSIKINCKEKQ